MDNISSALQSVGDAFSGGTSDAASQAASDASSFDAGSLGTGGGTLATGGAGADLGSVAAQGAADAGSGFVNAGAGIDSVLGGGTGGGATSAPSGIGFANVGATGAGGPVAAAIPAGITGGPGGSAAAIAAPSSVDVPFGSDQVPEQALNGKPTPPGMMSGIIDFIKKNPGLALGGAGIGANAILGAGSIPNIGNLTSAGNNAAGVAGLSSTLQTGQLPPGAQQMVTNALNDAVAGIKSRYAAMGLSGSSMETQDIQAAQERASAQTFQMADTLTQQGLSAAGMEDQIFSNIANLQLQQNKGLQDAIANFAGSAGLGAGLNAAKLLQQTGS